MALRVASMLAVRHSRKVMTARVAEGPIRTPLLFRSFSAVKYLASHEYIRLENGIGTVGITDYAQSQLGDVVFVDLPEVGEKFEKEETFGSVESVKAASDVYLPMGGEIVEVNELLLGNPEMVNSHAMSDAWFVKVKVDNEAEYDDLLDEAAYAEACKKEEEE